MTLSDSGNQEFSERCITNRFASEIGGIQPHFDLKYVLFQNLIPNLDLNNLTNLLIKSTLVKLVYSSHRNTVNINE